MTRILAFICLAIALCSCPDDYNISSFIDFNNNSNRFVSVEISYAYPDTTFSHKKECDPEWHRHGGYFYTGYFYPYCKSGYVSADISREEVFKLNRIIQVFVFSRNLESDLYADSLLERNEYTYDDLERMNWTVDYPSKKESK